MNSPKRRPFQDIRSQSFSGMDSPEPEFHTPVSRPTSIGRRKTPQSDSATPKRIKKPRTPLTPLAAPETPTQSVRTPRRTPKRSLEQESLMISSLLEGTIKWDATPNDTEALEFTPEKENCRRAVQSLSLNSPAIPTSPISTRTSLTFKRPKQDFDPLTPANRPKKVRQSSSFSDLLSGGRQLQRVLGSSSVLPAEDEAVPVESMEVDLSPAPLQVQRFGPRPFAHWNNNSASFSPLSTVTPVPLFQRSQSESAISIMQTMDLRDDDHSLIGDCSRRFVLPLVVGKHNDLKEISCQTLKALLDGDFQSCVHSFDLIDCRYPYEYAGGHIKGAVNLYTEQQVSEKFMDKKAPLPTGARSTERHILIFHCEFSAERGPRMCRNLRDWDRNCNLSSFPSLHYPELYVLNGGYKAFHESVPSHCDPSNYVRMIDPEHNDQLKFCKHKSKTELVKPKSASNLVPSSKVRIARQLSLKKFCI